MTGKHRVVFDLLRASTHPSCNSQSFALDRLFVHGPGNKLWNGEPSRFQAATQMGGDQ